MMERKLSARRTSSKLPELSELVMAMPLVSAGMVHQGVRRWAEAARRIVGELGLREMTGGGGLARGASYKDNEYRTPAAVCSRMERDAARVPSVFRTPLY
ncbi:hypothetical protein ASE60_33265 [Ensifer sp. Root278]|jgi:hypothetical protein|nr:hypothetical protein ASE60_33265 [Ensifer sp. Root278]